MFNVCTVLYVTFIISTVITVVMPLLCICSRNTVSALPLFVEMWALGTGRPGDSHRAQSTGRTLNYGGHISLF